MGSPEDIYRRPNSEFTATFTGECNILPYDVILKTLRVPETERSKIIYQCFGPEHRLLFRPEDMVVNDMPGLPFPEFFPHLRFENAKIIRSEYLGKEYLVTAQYEDMIIKVYTVYKPASDYITAQLFWALHTVFVVIFRFKNNNSHSCGDNCCSLLGQRREKTTRFRGHDRLCCLLNN